MPVIFWLVKLIMDFRIPVVFNFIVVGGDK